MIRLTIPAIDEDDLRAVREALASGYLVQGRRVAEFERIVAQYVGTDYAVAVSNCTAALHLSLLALGVGPGDRVAVPTYSWPATANVVALCGAEPLFIEIEPDTYNMDPEALEVALSSAKVKAVMPVHVFGAIADMRRIMSIAERHGASVIEDAACALGAALENKKAGAWGLMGCFSFHPRKAVTTGEGGIITSNDAALIRKLRALRNHGQDPDAATPDFIFPGYNLRITEFQAALGVSQMGKLDRIIEGRRAQAANYNRLLEGSELKTPTSPTKAGNVFQSYVVLVPTRIASRRTEIINALRQHGVEATIGTYHLPLTTYFRERGRYATGDFPVTDDVASRAISLPMFEGLTLAQQEKVANELLELTNANKAFA
jgi:dTDP-4-amino-4,6-dideoxygalactose transaminase